MPSRQPTGATSFIEHYFGPRSHTEVTLPEASQTPLALTISLERLKISRQPKIHVCSTGRTVFFFRFQQGFKASNMCAACCASYPKAYSLVVYLCEYATAVIIHDDRSDFRMRGESVSVVLCCAAR